MRLKEKTHKKFLDFFAKMAEDNEGNEFELAYSEIQRQTGAASVTLKRAIQSLADDGLIEIQPGRNSRYARFRYLDGRPDEAAIGQGGERATDPDGEANAEKEPVSGAVESLHVDVQVLSHLVENLRRRARTQEMTIALLQDRIAELEDLVLKR